MYLLEKNYCVPYEENDTEALYVSRNKSKLMEKAKAIAIAEYGALFEGVAFFEEESKSYIEREVRGATITYSVSEISEIYRGRD